MISSDGALEEEVQAEIILTIRSTFSVRPFCGKLNLQYKCLDRHLQYKCFEKFSLKSIKLFRRTKLEAAHIFITNIFEETYELGSTFRQKV